MSKAMRRAVRQRVALATEMNLHSVSLFGSVWTLHHPHTKHRQPGPQGAIKGTGVDVATSLRKVKSAKRLQDFQVYD